MKNERCLILSKDGNNLTREEINRRRNKTEKKTLIGRIEVKNT